jgi:hypothetical protein
MGDELSSGGNLLERIRVKGTDFDPKGEETPKNELFKMEGLFKLKDVQERIPIDDNRLKYWHSNHQSPFYSCFVKIPLGEKRSLVYVDLLALNAKLREQMEKTSGA